MTLEQQVADLVSATTELTGTVNAELNNVRAENTAFKATVVAKAPSATDNAIVVFDGASGSSIKKVSGVSVDSSGNATFNGVVFGKGSLNIDGNVSIVPLSSVNANTSGGGIVAIGWKALNANTVSSEIQGWANTAVGWSALPIHPNGLSNTALGTFTLQSITSGNLNTALGASSIHSLVTGSDNTGCGCASLFLLTSGNYNSGFGSHSLIGNTTFSNCTGLGYDAQVSGANQVQLGNSNTTTYAYGAVQNRSDLRDKTDIRPTSLGLSFIKALRPVDFRWDLRDSYRKPVPTMPANPSDQEKVLHDAEIAKWLEDNKLSNITHDGSKKGRRYHHGIIAQEIQELILTTGVDFGGFQDHKIAGGDDVLSIGYPEFIAPLIKAVQELSDMNDTLKERVKALEAKIA